MGASVSTLGCKPQKPFPLAYAEKEFQRLSKRAKVLGLEPPHLEQSPGAPVVPVLGAPLLSAGTRAPQEGDSRTLTELSTKPFVNSATHPHQTWIPSLIPSLLFLRGPFQTKL
jgi:hypothetical protein